MDTSKVPLGEPSGPFLNYADPGEIAAFALAINDDNPLYRDGRAVPPAYPVVPVFQATRGRTCPTTPSRRKPGPARSAR
jgi:hypothetical protein